MDMAYGSKGIRRIGNWSNAFSCEVQALIRRIFIVGYDVLTSILEWAVDKNGCMRIRGTSSSSVEARISLIMFEFSSCLIADFAINLDNDSSMLSLRSGYKEFLLFCWFDTSYPTGGYGIPALVDAYECDKIILDTYGDKVTLKRRRDDDDKDEEPSVGSDRGSKRKRACKEPESAKEPMQTTQDLEEPSHQEFETGAADDQPVAKASQHPEWFQKQKKPPTADRAWNTTLPAIHKSIQPWISDLAKQANSRASFNELMDTPIDFLAFLMNWLNVDTLTPELLAGPTYELMKGSCKSLVELEFFLEEVYKATTDQLDWNNPERQ
nr:hypothetical protein [Tanacetum cinerariifolium]